MAEPQIAIPQDEIVDFCRRNQVRTISLFGSVLREDFGPESDIDVLVEFEPEARVGFMALGRMQRELAELLALGLGPRREAHAPAADEHESGGTHRLGGAVERAVLHEQLEIREAE